MVPMFWIEAIEAGLWRIAQTGQSVNEVNGQAFFFPDVINSGTSGVVLWMQW
jgi:hypothetical protein